AAADERRDLGPGPVRHRHGGRGRNNIPLRKRADREVAVDVLAAAVDAGRAIGHEVAHRRAVGAEPFPAVVARSALPARRVPGQRDELPDAEALDARTDRLDIARALVTEDDRAGPL